MILLWLIASLILQLCLASKHHTSTQSDCERTFGGSLNAEKRKEICNGSLNDGPALCALAIKKQHVPHGDIVSLCNKAKDATLDFYPYLFYNPIGAVPGRLMTFIGDLDLDRGGLESVLCIGNWESTYETDAGK